MRTQSNAPVPLFDLCNCTKLLYLPVFLCPSPTLSLPILAPPSSALGEGCRPAVVTYSYVVPSAVGSGSTLHTLGGATAPVAYVVRSKSVAVK